MRKSVSALALVLSIQTALCTSVEARALSDRITDPCAKKTGDDLQLCRLNQEMSAETLGLMVETIEAYLAADAMENGLEKLRYDYVPGQNLSKFHTSFQNTIPFVTALASAIGTTVLSEMISKNAEYGGGSSTLGGAASFSISLKVGFDLGESIDTPQSLKYSKNSFAEDKARVSAEISTHAKAFVSKIAPIFQLSPETSLKLQKAIEAEIYAKVEARISAPYTIDVLAILKKEKWLSAEKAAAFDLLVALLKDVENDPLASKYESAPKFTIRALEETIAVSQKLQQRMKTEGNAQRDIFDRLVALEAKAESMKNRLAAAEALAK